jgi:putative ABC transport system permease protein
MLKNYFVTAYRNLVKNWSYSFINIIGLSVGLAASIFILLFVFHELSYDTFHKKSDRIYRAAVDGKMAKNTFIAAVTAAPMAEALLNEYPEIEKTVRVRKSGDWLVSHEDKTFNEEGILFADSTFFQIFTYKFIHGNPATALKNPESIVLTEKIARKYFGKTDVVGKSLRIESDTTYYTVTGVIQNVPENTHMHFDMMASLNTLDISRRTFWISHNFHTYILLKEGTDPQALENKLDMLVEKYVGPDVQQALGVSLEEFIGSGSSIRYFLQPVEDIHLHSHLEYELEANSHISYIYIFSIIAIFILLMASINYTNLATAKSASRSLEVGMRKVVGGTKRSLRFLFLIESVFLTLVSLFIAIVIVELLMPQYNNLVQLNLDINYFEEWYTIPGLIVLVTIVGLMAGSYPAFFLSSFKPVTVLKGKLKQGAKSSLVRKILVSSQFLLSIIILLATYTVYEQLNYMQNKELGFNKENILVLKRSDGLRNNMEAFKQEVAKNPKITAVSNAITMPGRNFSKNSFFIPGSNTTKLMNQAWISYDYNKVFDFKMKSGRFFSRDYPSDSSAIIINEAAVKNLGFEEDPVGKIIHYPSGPNGEMMEMNVIGVVKDFHYKSMHSPIEPACFNIMRGNWEGFVFLKINPEKKTETINFVKRTWKEFSSYPFQYFFFKNDFNRLYKTEKRTSVILILFSILSILIASLGLIGLISFTTMQRQKEIGIRKAFGSSTRNIILLLNREILLLIIYSTIIAWPVTYYITHKWLQDFSYRTELNYTMFLLIPAGILLLSLLVVTVRSGKAAMKNPAHTLRYE